MSDQTSIDYSARLKDALGALQKVRARLEIVEREKSEPVAVIGIGCRFPGNVTDPESYWQLLHNGVDGISEVPADRWNLDVYYDPKPGIQGKMYTRYGGFINAVDKFDSLFFGVSPREAQSMDPQQRLLLEVAWEALENAGLAPDQLGESATGVFIGVTMSDYLQVLSNLNSPDLTGTYRITGNLPNGIPGRVSYTLGLRGPAMAIDTACSSSLVAVHQAVQSLRNGETTMALAGGVNLLLSPEITISACQANMLAPDGRCKTFDSRADGFIRSDGVGVIVLKRLSDALKDGDHIWSVIRGSAVNHDGFSSGFSVPSKMAQEAVIRAALANADISSEYVGYVEAHGTGTSLGDPIEVRALESALGNHRDTASPLLLGSVKTNIGHTEAAAGIAGLIKTVLALYHNEIPPNLHLQNLNPFMDWSNAPFRVPTQPTPFPTINGRKVAGISSFGVSGINAHVIVEATPQPEGETVQQISELDRPYHVLSLSAQTEQALHQQAERVSAYVQRNPNLSLADICFTANTGRAQFNHRLGITVSTTSEMESQLANFISGKESWATTNRVLDHNSKPQIAFLFTGHGSQFINMGRALYETSPIFRKAIEECEVILQQYLDIPISKVLYPEPGTEGAVANLWRGMKYTQPAQFVLAFALVTLWKSWGIEPGAVIGHSVGEYAAACAAGMMSLADGIKLVAARGRLMDTLPGRGVMSAVFADQATVTKAVTPHANQVSIAVINGPTNIVISGNAEAIESIETDLKKQEIESKRLDVAQASHSPMVDPMLDEFEDIAASIIYGKPVVEYISCLTGQLATQIDSKYWRSHQRQTVHFADALQTLVAQGYTYLVEIGPMPTLITIAQRNLDGADDETNYYPSLRKGKDDWVQMLNSLTELYVHGAAIDWRGFDQPYLRRRVTLPTYPFQRQRYWAAQGSKPNNAQTGNILHPLLGTRIQSATKEIVFENVLSSQASEFLRDHVVNEQVILPSTAYMEILLAAARQVINEKMGSYTIEDLVIHTPLLLTESEASTIQIIVDQKTEGETACQIFSLDTATEQWRLHANAVVRWIAEQPSIYSLVEFQSRCPETMSLGEHYHRLTERGLSFGPAFRGMTSLQLGKNEALAQIESPEAVTLEMSSYDLHPALLDSALQTVAALLPQGDKTYLPISVDSVKVFDRLPSKLWSHATLKSGKHSSNDLLTANIELYDDAGKCLVVLDGFTLKQAASLSVDSWLYEVQWQKAPKRAATPDDLTRLLQASLNSMAGGPEMVSYDREFLPRMDALCAALIQNALLEMGWSFEAESTFTFDDVSSRLSVAKQHNRLFNRLLEILEEEGVLSRHGENWKVIRPFVRRDTAVQAESLRSAHREAKIEVDMVERIGREFALALQGQRNPLELLFPAGSLDEVETLYRDAPFTRSFNQVMGHAVKEFAKNWQELRPLRILEIGAGTGGATTYVLGQLSNVPVEYTFTDISPLFLNKASQKFAQYDFVQFRTLDIEQDPIVQGFEPHYYDLILATNVLHATSALHETVKRVRELLVPGGFLFAVEGTRKQRFADLIVGLTPGWWAFRDNDLRSSYALLSQSQWLKLFKETDFVLAEGITGQSALSNQSLLIAQTEPSLPANTEGTWLLFTEDHSLSNQLAEKLRTQDQTVHFVNTGDTFARLENDYQVSAGRVDDFHKLFQANGELKGIVYLWALDAHSDSVDIQALLCGGLLYLVQALVASGKTCPIWVVTKGAQSANGQADFPRQATLWGLCKVINQEHPELSCRVIDVDPNPLIADKETLDNLWMEISATDSEDQVAYRDHERLLPRLVRARASEDSNIQSEPVKLTVDDRGVLDNLVYQPLARRSPGLHEVEIRVIATGIGFRDVLNTLGMYPDGGELGSECAGIVTAVGSDVTNVQVGDSVIAVALGSFASYVLTPSHFVVSKPVYLTFAEAATIPSAFLTTQYALHHLAKMKAGDRVLIHAAAGGVGLAAVQLAQRIGTEIFGTAGSASKRDFLKSLGVQHVMDSRSLDFADEIMQLTDGRGVDIVLNSLADEFISKSISVLAERGRFIEIGKRGIWSKEQFTQLKPEAFYEVVDLLLEAQQKKDLIPRLFQEIMSGFTEGTLISLPFCVYPASEVADAFRIMAKGGHTGKLVMVQDTEPFKIYEDATYLITGGLGGLGLTTAEWLMKEGARHLVLVGRNAPKENVLPTLQNMMKAGIDVKIMQADVSKREEMEGVLIHIAESMPALKGVIHAAGLLDDGVLSQQTWERFSTVFAPKVQGGWNLHELTKGMALDFFVLYSSAVSLVGSAGQANHVAASTYLDVLAHHRRARGLPGLSIGWGPWTQVGAAAERDVSERLISRGIESISPNQAIESLSRVMHSSHFTHIGILYINWEKFASQSISPFFHEIKQQAQAQKAGSTASSNQSKQEGNLWKLLASASESKRKKILLRHVHEKVLKVLNLPADFPLEQHRPLQELGLDSLMAVELRNLLGGGLSLSRALPATLVFDYPTPEALARYLMDELFNKVQKDENIVQAVNAEAALLDEELSEEEAEALLLAELNELKHKESGKQ